MNDKRVGADAENVASIGNVKAHVACIVVASYKSHGNAQPRYNISKFHLRILFILQWWDKFSRRMRRRHP